MLRELTVKNLAVIEDIRVELEPGFCAWTGETGAGKTLLLQALGLIIGERGSAELIREGAEETTISGRFEAPQPAVRAELEEILQSPLADEHVLITRRLTAAGRSLAYVDDTPVTLATLRKIGGVLVDIHGQRESQALLDPVYQLRMLDIFGGQEELSAEFRRQADALRELRRQLAEREAGKQQRQRELNLLRFERDELDTARLKTGELKELAQEREKLQHAQGIYDFATEASNRLYDEDGAVFEVLRKVEREAERFARFDPELADIAKRIAGLAVETQDLAQSLRPWSDSPQADPERLEEVENRIQMLRRLETKYARSVDELIEYRKTLDAEESRLTSAEEDREALSEKIGIAHRSLRETGVKLSKERAKSAKKFAALVQKELADLSMPDARLDAVLTPTPLGDDSLACEIPSNGLESLELMLAANPGEPSRPLRKVASGGEMSRTMLAVKTVLAVREQGGLMMVFDEIDSNVGGRLGDVLGAKLAALGRTRQVVCVTHLPQVACYARSQWTIRKTKKAKRTTTTIEKLDSEARIEELSSMLRGASRGETTRKEAEAMLQAASKKW